MAKENLTKTNNYDVSAREIDFVTRFQQMWEALRDILGIMRPISKIAGTVLKSKVASVSLQNGEVGEGDEIPYSQAQVKTVDYEPISIEKFRKGVSIESIDEYGYDVAVAMTDEAFLNELQSNVMDRFYTYLGTGTLTSTETTWQMALAMAKSYVVNQFKSRHLSFSRVVGFVNEIDVGRYLGSANITIQTRFGFRYVQDFMGYDVLFILSDAELQRGRVIATPVDNIVLYYVNPSDSSFAKAGLVYRTVGNTPLIGFHIEGDYSHAVSDTFAIMGITLFAEYLDGIAVVDVDDTPTLGSLTVTSAAGTEVGDTAITVSPEKSSENNVYKYKVGAQAALVNYGQNVANWTVWDGTTDITASSGQVITIVEADGAYIAINAGSATVVAKEE